MRLTKEKQEIIIKLFHKYFPTGALYLFGSRLNDNARGGDIDLLCEESGNMHDMVRKKMAFLVELENTIGEQHIDVILSRSEANKHSEVIINAKKEGIRLV